MPLLYTKELDDDVILGVWKIDDSLQMESVCPEDVCMELKSACESRRKETTAVYAMLRQLTGINGIHICHQQNGRPFLALQSNKDLEWKEIGVSHTKGYASIIVSKGRNVSVDIEYRNERIRRIANRFLRTDENTGATDTTSLLLYWCSKETLFKYYSNEELTFQNIKVCLPTNILHGGQFLCKNLINNESIAINYTQNNDYILTYCI